MAISSEEKELHHQDVHTKREASYPSSSNPVNSCQRQQRPSSDDELGISGSHAIISCYQRRRQDKAITHHHLIIFLWMALFFIIIISIAFTKTGGLFCGLGGKNTTDYLPFSHEYLAIPFFLYEQRACSSLHSWLWQQSCRDKEGVAHGSSRLQ